MRAMLPALSLSLSLCACSLVDLSDIPLAEPPDSEACAEVNARAGIDPKTDCEVYQHVSGVLGCVLGPKDFDEDGALDANCEGHPLGVMVESFDCDDGDDARSPRLAEGCDGVDNDCDGVVDEGLVGPDGSGEASDVLGTLPLSSVRVGTSVRIASARGGRTIVSGIDGRGGTVLRVLDADGALGESLPSTVSVAGIDTPKLSDLALAAADGSGSLWVAAAVITSECAGGQLALGHHAPDEREGLRLRPEATGSSNFSAPRKPAGGCLQDGTHDPTLHAFGDGSALLTYRTAAPAEDPVCGDPGAEGTLWAYGVWLQDDALGRRFVNVSGDGEPTRLDRTQAGSGAAVVAFQPESEGVAPARSQRAGYYVAYVASGGQIRLRFVPALDADPTAFARGEALTLEVGEAFDVASRHGADQVALAAGPDLVNCDQGPCTELIVAWQQGCGTADASVHYARVLHSPRGGFARPDKPKLAVKGNANLASMAPALAYTDDAWAADATASSTGGGYVLAYRSGLSDRPDGVSLDTSIDRVSGLIGAMRIARSGERLDGEPWVFDVTVDGELGVPLLFATSDPPTLHYAFTRAGESGGSGASFEGGATCAP